MELQLIKGSFSAEEAIDILTRVTNAKIQFHESKIDKTAGEEDIKMREKRIHELQRNLHEIRSYIQSRKGSAHLEATIDIK